MIQEKIRQRMREDRAHRSEEKKRSERSLDDTTELLVEIEEIRDSLTEERRNSAERLADRAEHVPASLDEARTRIDFQLARISENYSALLEAGNVRSRSDGTFEIVELSGLTEPQERMARLAIEQDNAYIVKSHQMKSAIERMTTVVNERRSELGAITASSSPELLRKLGSPEELYRETLSKIIETYRPEEGEGRTQGTPRTDAHPGTPETTTPREAPDESSGSPKNAEDGAREHVVGSPRDRLLELASKARESIPKESAQERGMGY
ncbi:hypothetical protein [Nocardiopsis eucommiae]|uniref:hypothetical protein n=1 Tax=Nocardiopsis eucommiae TaxID=2831970 RepID=UPI003D7444B5